MNTKHSTTFKDWYLKIKEEVSNKISTNQYDDKFLKNNPRVTWMPEWIEFNDTSLVATTVRNTFTQAYSDGLSVSEAVEIIEFLCYGTFPSDYKK